jgi:hypothetical protein
MSERDSNSREALGLSAIGEFRAGYKDKTAAAWALQGKALAAGAITWAAISAYEYARRLKRIN